MATDVALIVAEVPALGEIDLSLVVLDFPSEFGVPPYCVSTEVKRISVAMQTLRISVEVNRCEC